MSSVTAVTTVLEPRPQDPPCSSDQRARADGGSETGFVTGSGAGSAVDESALVVRAKSGDAAAREVLARMYRQSAYIFALQLLGNREDALDVAQDSLLRFFVNLHRFDHRRPIAPWLRRIVHNGVIDLHRRKRVRRADSLDSSGPEGSPMEVEDPKVDTAKAVQLKQRQEVVWSCLRYLGKSQREIVVLRDYQDLSYKEIADALEVPMGTVMSRLHRARHELRSRVFDELDRAKGDLP